MMNESLSKDHLDVAGIIASISAVLIAIWRKRSSLWRHLKAMIDFASKADQILASCARNEENLALVQKELRGDNGKSLKDVVLATHDLAHLAESRTKSLMSASLVASFECEPTYGRCVWVNGAICDLFGLDEHEMLGNGWLRAVDEPERAEVLKKWRDSITNDIPWSWTFTIVNSRTNERVRVRSSANAFKTSDGKVMLYSGVVVPVK